MVSVCYSIMMWKKAYELLYISFLYHEQFFTDWNVMAILNININHSISSYPGTAYMSLIVDDGICSIIIKTTMEPGPWTLITYSAHVLICWTQAMGYPLCGMWCNSKPLSMICLVLLRLRQYWYNLFRAVGRRYCRLFFVFWIYLPPYGVSKLLAPLHWKSLWSKRDGGYGHSS